METRLARREDLLGLLRLYRHLHPDGWLEEGPQALQVWEEIWETPGYRIVVGEEGGELVSSCTVVIVPNLTHGGRPYALVENVVTRPDCRNRGFATACLDFARDLAREAGCYKIMLLTGSKRESTLAFYRKAGYRSDVKTGFYQAL